MAFFLQFCVGSFDNGAAHPPVEAEAGSPLEPPEDHRDTGSQQVHHR